MKDLAQAFASDYANALGNLPSVEDWARALRAINECLPTAMQAERNIRRAFAPAPPQMPETSSFTGSDCRVTGRGV